MSDVLNGWQEHNQHILNQLRAGKDDEFLLQQSLEDAANGFCTSPLRRPDFLRLIGNKAHRLIPRCVITQSSGKQRVIDNGDTGGQSALSSDANKLTLCSPFAPSTNIFVWQCIVGRRKRLQTSWPTMPGRQDRKIYLQHTGTALWQCRKVWGVWWSGTITNGKPLHTKSMLDCFLGFRLQSHLSTDFPDCWRR